jgi:hypothetical protein
MQVSVFVERDISPSATEYMLDPGILFLRVHYRVSQSITGGSNCVILYLSQRPHRFIGHKHMEF